MHATLSGLNHHSATIGRCSDLCSQYPAGTSLMGAHLSLRFRLALVVLFTLPLVGCGQNAAPVAATPTRPPSTPPSSAQISGGLSPLPKPAPSPSAPPAPASASPAAQGAPVSSSAPMQFTAPPSM